MKHSGSHSHHRSKQSLLDLIYNFFNSPMWLDTIKDFILSNCYMWTGDEEFSLEHLQCHKDFCTVIENTLNIYLLEVLGVDFSVFENAVIASAKNPNSIAQKVLTILKQATDFKYFAAKMYAYNLMLDREVFSTFLEQNNQKLFFDTNLSQEIKINEDRSQNAISQVHEVEKFTWSKCK